MMGTLVLEAFGGVELLAIAIPTIVPLVFLLSLYLPCLCTEDINYVPVVCMLIFNIFSA